MTGVLSSIFFIVIGAITRYAYSDSVWRWHSGGQAHSLQLDTIGLILIWAGVVGLFLSIIFGFLFPNYFEDTEYDEYDRVVDNQPGEKPVKIVRRRRRY